MDEIIQKVDEFLNKTEKEKLIFYIIDALATGKIDIVALYEKILAPALKNIASNDKTQEIRIWQEHIQTSMVRTAIECCYPYVIKERDGRYRIKQDKKVSVLCPLGEYHEIGPRMASDFFTLCGYEALFVGGNTPKDEMLSIIQTLRPDYIAISVSNYYHIIAAQRTIKEIRKRVDYSGKILVGGYAFKRNVDLYKEIGADKLIDTFEDIFTLEGECVHEAGI